MEDLEGFSDSGTDSNTLQLEDLTENDASGMDISSPRASPTMTDMDYVCADISHSIGTLFRVSVLIQYAEAPEKIEKYTKFPVSHEMDIETQRIKDMFPYLIDRDANLMFLVKRLAEANLRRRQMFCYALSQHTKIVAPEIPVQQNSERLVTGAQAALSQTGTFSFPQPAMSVPRARSEATGTPCIEPNTLQHPQYEPQSPPKSQAHLESPSEYSPSEVSSEYSSSEASSISSSHVSVEVSVMPTYMIPPRPKPLPGKQTHSECPYCFKIISVSSDSEWKYVCCLEYALSSRT